MIRTDLAEESAAQARYEGPGFYREHEDGVLCVRIESKEAADAIGKPEGIYYTVETDSFLTAPDAFEEDTGRLAKVIGRLLPEPEQAPVLVAGLGNRMITPDAVGPLAVQKILVTRHLKEAGLAGFEGLRAVAAVSPGVLGQTGIEAATFVQKLSPIAENGCVIVIDALAAGAPERLLKTVQICNSGIAPGSGVGNNRTALNKESVGVPVIAVGVPTVAALSNIAELPENMADMIVTPREIDQAVEHASRTVAFALNRALYPSLSLEELTALVG
ncbi:MAG: GPR endopeptidase [Oscillospiraceae bacterium]|nr:GPR endopeptidase [Oscillospiraceae bacterium]MDY3065700.1 GPR endopeptidase [Oscillospiraceae bacterium]